MDTPISLTFNITAGEALNFFLGLTASSDIMKNATSPALFNVAELSALVNKNSKSCSGYLFCISWHTLWYFFLGFLIFILYCRDAAHDCEENVLEKRRANEEKLTKEGAHDKATYLPVTVSDIAILLCLPSFLSPTNYVFSRQSRVSNTGHLHTNPTYQPTGMKAFSGVTRKKHNGLGEGRNSRQYI